MLFRSETFTSKQKQLLKLLNWGGSVKVSLRMAMAVSIPNGIPPMNTVLYACKEVISICQDVVPFIAMILNYSSSNGGLCILLIIMSA